jgi:hypothetical protein
MSNTSGGFRIKFSISDEERVMWGESTDFTSTPLMCSEDLMLRVLKYGGD